MIGLLHSSREVSEKLILPFFLESLRHDLGYQDLQASEDKSQNLGGQEYYCTVQYNTNRLQISHL